VSRTLSAATRQRPGIVRRVLVSRIANTARGLTACGSQARPVLNDSGCTRHVVLDSSRYTPEIIEGPSCWLTWHITLLLRSMPE
jgi:hypothetical protein